MEFHKQIIQDLADSKGLEGVSVRIGKDGHVYFIKRAGRVLHDQAFDFDEAVNYLTTYDVGESRREDVRGNGR